MFCFTDLVFGFLEKEAYWTGKKYRVGRIIGNKCKVSITCGKLMIMHFLILFTQHWPGRSTNTTDIQVRTVARAPATAGHQWPGPETRETRRHVVVRTWCCSSGCLTRPRNRVAQGSGIHGFSWSLENEKWQYRIGILYSVINDGNWYNTAGQR